MDMGQDSATTINMRYGGALLPAYLKEFYARYLHEQQKQAAQQAEKAQQQVQKKANELPLIVEVLSKSIKGRTTYYTVRRYDVGW